MARWAMAALLALASVLAACAAPDSDGGGGIPTPSASMVDCGNFTLDQGGRLPDSALSCFAGGLAAGDPVQLTVTRPTVEGDPILTVYRGTEPGHVEVFVDARQDRFGRAEVTRMVCQQPVAENGELIFGECSSPTTVPS